MSPMMFWRAISSVAGICRRSACPTVGANFQTSGMRAESESNMAVSSSLRSKSTGKGSFIATKQRKGKLMKRLLLSIALACVAPFAWGQVSETTTTTTTTDASGTITEYTPGSAIVLKETSGPVRYRFGKSVTYVTRSGKPLDETTVKTKVKVGVPVRVHYVGTGDSMMVDRVILDED